MLNASASFPFSFSVCYMHMKATVIFLNRMLIRSNQGCNLKNKKYQTKQRDWIRMSMSLHFSVRGFPKTPKMIRFS